MFLSGGSNFAVGVILSLQALGMVITPLIGANLIEHRRRVLPVGFITGGIMRGTVLLIGLAGLFLPPPVALIAIGVFILAFGLFMGIQGVVFNFLMSKVIPVSKRGRLTGLRNFLAGLTSATVAWLGGTFFIGESPTVEATPTPSMAFVLISIGLAMLVVIREPEPPTVRRPRAWQPVETDPRPAPGRSGLRSLRRRPGPRHHGRMAAPFYIPLQDQPR